MGKPVHSRRTIAKAINLNATLTPQQSGVRAVLTLKKPNTQIITKYIVTDPAGVAIAQFALDRTDMAGIYQGSVTMNVDGQTISNQTSIMVR